MTIELNTIDGITLHCKNMERGSYFKFSAVVEMSYPGLIAKLREEGMSVEADGAFFIVKH
jgi:hypothetical protein